jgi:WD40 repeat protein
VSKKNLQPIDYLRWSFDGRVLAFVESRFGASYLWHKEEGNEAVRMPGKVDDLCFLPNSHNYATLSRLTHDLNYSLTLWNADQATKAHTLQENGHEYSKLACSLDGRYLAASGFGTTADISVWDLKNRRLLKTFPAHREPEESSFFSKPKKRSWAPIEALAFSIDGAFLASACGDISNDDRRGNAEVKVWKLER